jgi:hypothetical protein
LGPDKLLGELVIVQSLSPSRQILHSNGVANGSQLSTFLSYQVHSHFTPDNNSAYFFSVLNRGGKAMRTSFFVGTFLLGIAGCAGGGGGGGSGSSAVGNPAPSIVTFTSFSSVQPNSTVRMSGRAVTGDYQFDLNQNEITAVSLDGFDGLTADVTVGDQFGAGNITSGSIDPANGATLSFSCATDTCVDADPFASAIGVNSSDGTKILFVAAPADSQFEYQT